VRPSVSHIDLINNIGAPFDNTSAFVLDPESDIILPRGAIGELCFGGTQVFRGYLNRPELNTAKIIDHPLYGRIYRSGDMGLLLPDNNILSTGRSDDQVKIRGQRVELGEITSVVLDNEDVQDCTTLLLSQRHNITNLVSFWVPRTKSLPHFQGLSGRDFQATIQDLFASLSRLLPAYMVPSYLLPISQLPMTAQAKVDKRLLRTVFQELSDVEMDYAGPAHETNGEDISETTSLTEWEKSVADVLITLLDLETRIIRRNTSFFNLGLDSVSAIRFCNVLRSLELGDYTITTVLKNPTIAHLASLKVRTGPEEILRKPLLALDDVFVTAQTSQIHQQYKERGLRVEKILPCTPLQEAMLASSQSSKSTYSNTMIFNINGDAHRLQQCWTQMIQRHEILRTSFTPTDHSTYAFAQVVVEFDETVWGMRSQLFDSTTQVDQALFELLETQKPPIYLAMQGSGTSKKLVFGCHHALYDGIAISTLLQEIQDAYHGSKLPPPISYHPYLEHMVSQDTDGAHEYWATCFADFEPNFFPDLTGSANKHNSMSKTAERTLQVPLEDVRKACQSASVTMLSVVQAAWVKLLHFYIGEDDLCFGNIVSGRSLPGDDLSRVVAPCFNTLPVRVKFDFRQSNIALSKYLHLVNVESLDHQLTALRRIQNIALTEGGRLFDTLVILQQPQPSLDESIWTLEKDVGEMDLPVVCEIFQDTEENVLKLVLHYHTDLISETNASVITETFDNSLAALISLPDAAANSATRLPAHLRAESNLEYQRFQTESDLLHAAFQRNASSQPERIALDFLGADGQRAVWSYQDLNKKANGIAQILIEGGIGPEDIVPIHLFKTPAFYCSILGVLKAGAAFAPIYPELPEARKRLMLEDLRPKVVLCSDDTLLVKEDTLASIINITSLPQGSTENPSIDGLGDSSLAYCLYTSGSTGVPKAVNMEHRAPVQTIESSRSLVPWDGSSRLLQYAAITFDMCYYDCFLAWTLGFTLCAAEQQEILNELPRTINSLNIDLLDLTPSVAASLSRSEVPSVKWLYCIGEAMSASVVKRWAGACVNSYGPTEAAFCTTIYPVPKDVKTSIIGKPFPTTTFAVYGPQCEQPLPLLSVGELYIGGAQLARGYLGKQELTAERFIHKCGQRFYRTGDMVRMLSDGNFEFIGRKDDQVKIRGLRVELGEINHILQDSDAGITDVTAQILKKEATAKDQLVAFLVTRDSTEERQLLELRNKVNEAALSRLPAYMVPQFYIFVDDIPKSMAGKVDKKKLAKLFCDNVEAQLLENGANQSSSNHDWTEVEIHIRDIFARLSKVSANDIQPMTTIYELGMDSISAVQVAAALRKYSYHVSASDVMKYTTCATLAKHAVKPPSATHLTAQDFDFDKFQRKHISSAAKSCGIEVAEVDRIYPCTPLQKGMISQFIGKRGATYLNHLRLHMLPGTDLAKMRQAWVTVMKHHRMLRTGFTHIQDAHHPFLMVCHTEENVTLPWSQGHNESIEDWLLSLQRKFLDKLHQPLWEIRVVCQDQHTYLDLAIFHALFDAHSLDMIFRDVVTAYYGTSVPTPVPFEPLLGNILQLGRKGNTEAENFWCELGRLISSSRFPNLTPLREQPESPVVLTKRSSTPLHDLQSGCRKENITLQSAGVASWSSLVSAYTGEPTVTIGVVLSGRNIDLAENTVFPCINTVPFPCTIAEKKGTTLRSIMELNAEIQKHQFTPLSDIQRLIGRPNEPIFDSIFAYQKLASKEDDNGLWRIVDENATTEYPISIELEPKGEQLEYRLSFFPHIIPNEQGELILEQLDHLLHGFIFPVEPSADESICDELLYSITPPKEQILPSEVSLLHEFVEFTANNRPHQAALEFADSIDGQRFSSKSWTYQELNEEGNRIAHLLLSRDIQPGNLIGVCFEKCPEASFAMLGILKVGCAFVAIDPGAPSARQAFIVKDSGALAVLSMRAQSNGFDEIVDVPVLNLDQIATDTFSRTNPTLQRAIEPQDRSYCLYTSGTTGTPKGCELTHENAVQALLAFQRLFAGHWDANSRWLQFASFHFDVSVLEQYWSWSVGICVVSAPRDLIFEDLANSIRTLNITHIDLTPSLAQTLHPDDVPSLCKGVFITGGESLKQEILDAWGPKSVIYNGYGPTEATIGVTMYPRVPSNGKPSNIGPQFDNVGSFVLQPGADVPVLRGAVGELCVSGKLVGKGYLNRMELTEERFPHLANFDERVYRTGDLVRILYNGTFDFLGRADDQVKLRGQRLETGEINSVIRQSGSAISDVATLVLKHPKQQKEQLVAFVVVKSKLTREPKILETEGNSLVGAKEACHERLPPYMVPTHFIPLTSMPLNVNNKSDGKKLKEIYENISANDLQRLSTASNGSSEHWSDLDNKILRVLKEAMAIGDVTIEKDTNFFELGMDSISVIGVSKAMKEADFKNASVSLIMRNPTIRQLAKSFSPKGTTTESRNSLVASQQAIDAIQHRHRRNVAQMMAINPQDIEAIAPCTPLQQGMIARYLDSDDGLYFNTFEFRLHDHVKEDELQDAWAAVYISTQILRTVFMKTDDGYVQAALRNVHVPWRVQTTDSETLSQCIEDTKRSWLQANSAELVQPFEVILVATPQERLLLVHIFHALYDGISIDLMFQSFWNAYKHREIKTDAPPFQSVLARGPLQPAEGAKKFWETHLSNVTSRPFPVLANEVHDRSIVVTRNLSALSAYDSTRRKLNVTAQAIAQACWLRVLQEHYHSVVTVGMVVSGRNFDYDGADRIVGPLFNTIPYQYHPRPREAWSSLIHRVHEFNLAALPYQHTPLRDVTKWCKRSHDQPLFDTLFVYQVADESQEWAKNDAWELQDGDTVADYPLAFEIEQRGNDSWALTLVAQGQISDTDSSSRLLQRFEETLKEVLADPVAILETNIDNEITNTNGVRDMQVSPSESTNSMKFVWTTNAIRIRDEIALLANTEAEEITEMTSILELGLDSIDAIKLSSKLKKHGITLPVSGVMRGLTVKRMEQNIADSQSRLVPTPADVDSILHKSELKEYFGQCRNDSNEIDRVLPLTPLQEAMVADMVASDFRRYYNHDVLRISQDVDIKRLRDAWSQVVADSPILRTSFVEVDNPEIPVSFAQIIHVYPHNFWTQTESDSEPDFPAIFESLRIDAIRSNSSKPPFRILLVQCPVQSYLVLSVAHALYDGHSLSLLHSDVMDAYHGQYSPRPDYEPVLADILSSSSPDAAHFWQDYLMGTQPSSVLQDSNKQHESPDEVHRLEQASVVALSDMVAFVKRRNVSLQTLGQTVFALTLAWYTHSLDVVFGSVLSGRDDDTRAQLLLPTMNTVAIRTILHGTRSEMLQYVQENFTDIHQWQHYPLRKALSAAKVASTSINSLFIYQKNTTQDLDEHEKLYESTLGQSDVEYPVCVEMEVVGNTLMWRCAMKDGVLSEKESHAFLGTLDTVLGSILAQPNDPTIETTPQGTSICGLPAFERENPQVQNEVNEPARQDQKPMENMPRLHTENKIREILALVSRIPEDEIETSMSIYHIGLDSISAIKVSSLLRKQGVTLSVGEMLKAGTVENMALIAEQHNHTVPEVKVNAEVTIREFLHDLDQADLIKRSGTDVSNVEQILPVSGGQLYMLSMWVNSGGSNFYPEFKYELKGSVALHTIRDSWQTMVAIHPILRTTFVTTKVPSIPYVQIVLREVQDSLIDLTGVNEEEKTPLVEQHASHQPWAHVFVSKNPTGWGIQLKIHHALYDGVSLPLLMQGFEDCCNSIRIRTNRNMLVEYIASGCSLQTQESRKSFWCRYLEGIESQHLNQASTPATARAEIFKPGFLPISGLELIARRTGISMQALFLAAYARVHASSLGVSNDKDMVIGVYLANRSLPLDGIASATVPTVNILPLRVQSPFQSHTVDIAIQIQHDLRVISQLENVHASLFEINTWTGVKVDSFVNFLSLPDTGEDEATGSDDTKIKISPVGEWGSAVSRVVELHKNATFSEDEIDAHVNGAYLVSRVCGMDCAQADFSQHAIDIEATVRNDGIDIGIFGPSSILSLEAGEQRLKAIEEELQALE
jgi:amino acid adenylation domain-containing protein